MTTTNSLSSYPINNYTPAMNRQNLPRTTPLPTTRRFDAALTVYNGLLFSMQLNETQRYGISRAGKQPRKQPSYYSSNHNSPYIH